jgi:small subunit ribosomal protein S4
MGQPKFPRKKYQTPLHPWKEERIQQERELIKKYGLKNHKEVWRAKTYLGRYRQQARELLALLDTKNPQIKKESDQLLLHLTRMGILPIGATLDDVLALDIETVLSRRLQTLVYLKGFASTASQSRQLISHGHVKIDARKITIPGYLVDKDEEEFIGYAPASPLNEFSHPARPKADMLRSDILPAGEPPVEQPVATPPKEAKKPSPPVPAEKKELTPEKDKPKEVDRPQPKPAEKPPVAEPQKPEEKPTEKPSSESPKEPVKKPVPAKETKEEA